MTAKATAWVPERNSLSWSTVVKSSSVMMVFIPHHGRNPSQLQTHFMLESSRPFRLTSYWKRLGLTELPVSCASIANPPHKIIRSFLPGNPLFTRGNAAGAGKFRTSHRGKKQRAIKYFLYSCTMSKIIFDTLYQIA